MKNSLLLCSLVVVAATSSPSADEGRIPLFRPTTITQPGHYILTRDIHGSSGAVIQIAATNVTIDLNGHLISSADPGSDLIEILSPQNAAVAVRNGRLSDGHLAIFSPTNGVRLSVERVDIENVGRAVEASSARSVRLVACRISGTTIAPAILIRGLSGAPATGEIIDNLITDGAGMSLENFRGGVVRSNVIENVINFPGIRFAGDVPDNLGGTLIDRNIVRQGTNGGIEILAGDSNLVTNNSITGLGGVGILVGSSGNRLSDNVVSRSGGSGVYLPGDHNTLERNTIRRSNGGVFVLGNSNLIDDNVIEGNPGAGITFGLGTGNAYRANMLRDNTSGAVIGTGTDAGGNIF